MARLTALPSIDIIRGFKGTLDFYVRRGVPCVRRWPRRTTRPPTEAQIAAWTTFGQISTNYRLLAPLALQAFQEAAKTQPRTARDLYISAVYGHLHERTIPEPPPPPEEEMYDAYICVRDLKNAAVHGGTFDGGDWRTRDLNHEQADTKEICALGDNQITLPAGTYRCLITCPAFDVHNHQARLYDTTGAATLLLGSSCVADQAYSGANPSLIQGRFTLATQSVLEVQHRCALTRATSGFGYASNWAQNIYTIAEFWRETEAE
ncbi:hypothetical protein ES703_23051 [subsurface metagenome]